jgi:uncharacterized repeat protein (TIGR03847 family)
VSASFDLDPVTRLAAGAVGEPGERIFYLQARSQDQVVTLLVEKEQVRALAVLIEQMLAALPGSSEPEPELSVADADIQEPLIPEWRVGPMALQYDDVRDRIVLVASEALPVEDEEPGPSSPDVPEGATARFVATRAQARVLAEHAATVVDAGRPRCRFCGFPMDPGGHTCPTMNGHREG